MIPCFSSTFYFSAFFHFATASRPNILVIVADDLGYNDVSWHNPDIISPNLARHNFILEFADVQYAVIRWCMHFYQVTKSRKSAWQLLHSGLQKKDWCWNNHMCSQSAPQLGGQGIFIPKRLGISMLMKISLAFSSTLEKSFYSDDTHLMRSALMSGLYPIHTGRQHSVLWPEEPRGLRTSLTLLPRQLTQSIFALKTLPGCSKRKDMQLTWWASGTWASAAKRCCPQAGWTKQTTTKVKGGPPSKKIWNSKGFATELFQGIWYFLRLLHWQWALLQSHKVELLSI